MLEVGLAPSMDDGGMLLLAVGLCCTPAAGGVRVLATAAGLCSTPAAFKESAGVLYGLNLFGQGGDGQYTLNT